MKHQKKIKAGGRKETKQNKKKKTLSFQEWLTPERNKRIRALADKLTREATDRVQKLPRHQRLFCPVCKKQYCIHADGSMNYCYGDCKSNIPPKSQTKGCTWVGCSNIEIKAERTCENCM